MGTPDRVGAASGAWPIVEADQDAPPRAEPAGFRGRRAGQQDVAKGGQRAPIEAADWRSAAVIPLVSDQHMRLVGSGDDIADPAAERDECVLTTKRPD